MMRILLVILLMVNISYAGGARYFIKLGSFKNYQVLAKSINKMPKSLRSHTSIIYVKGWYIPFSYYKKSKKGLSSKVKLYKKYFPAARVRYGRRLFSNKVIYKFGKSLISSSVKRMPLKKIKSTPVKKRRVTVSSPKIEPTSTNKERVTLENVAISSNGNTLNIPIHNYSSQNIPSILEELSFSSKTLSENIEQKKYNFFKKQMLSGNHYYMAYKANEGETNLLIKVSFGADRVSYQPMLGDMQMTEANYLIENHKLYMFADKFSSNGAYSTLDKHRKKYFLVSSWMGIKKLNTLRYYYKLNDAKEYLGVRTSAGLSEVLEEGNFDEFFLGEDNN